MIEQGEEDVTCICYTEKEREKKSKERIFLFIFFSFLCDVLEEKRKYSGERGRREKEIYNFHGRMILNYFFVSYIAFYFTCECV